MREANRKAMHNMRQAAVEDYRKCIFDCLKPASDPALLLDCGCDDGEWTLKLGTRLGKARLYGIEVVEKRRALAVYHEKKRRRTRKAGNTIGFSTTAGSGTSLKFTVSLWSA